MGQNLLQALAEVTDQCQVYFDVLVDFGSVDFEVDFIGIGSVRFSVTGNAIVEAHPHGQE